MEKRKFAVTVDATRELASLELESLEISGGPSDVSSSSVDSVPCNLQHSDSSDGEEKTVLDSPTHLEEKGKKIDTVRRTGYSIVNCRLFLGGINKKVKVLFVRNLMLSTTEAHIMDVFSAYGVVERVKKLKDFAFIHFQQREEALKAMEAINVLDGAMVEVTLARPVDKDTCYLQKRQMKTSTIPAFYMQMDQYGSFMYMSPTHLSPPTNQHRFTLKNSMGACMVPSSPRLPKPASPVSVRGQGGPVLYPMASTSRPSQKMNHQNSPVKPRALLPTPPQQAFYDAPVQKRMAKQEFPPNTCAPVSTPPLSQKAELLEVGEPEVEVPEAALAWAAAPALVSTSAPAAAPAAAVVEVASAIPAVEMERPVPVLELPGAAQSTPSATKNTKSSALLLEELCQRNNWSSPIYSLYTSASVLILGERETLFMYKVTIGNLGFTYVPPKMSRNLAEAKETAADNVLMQLGCPVKAPRTASPSRGYCLPYSEASSHLHPVQYSPGYITYMPHQRLPVCSWSQPMSSMDPPYSSLQQFSEYYQPPF